MLFLHIKLSPNFGKTEFRLTENGLCFFQVGDRCYDEKMYDAAKMVKE